MKDNHLVFYTFCVDLQKIRSRSVGTILKLFIFQANFGNYWNSFQRHRVTYT